MGGRAISAAATDDFFRSSMVFDSRLVFRIDAGDVSILFFFSVALFLLFVLPVQCSWLFCFCYQVSVVCGFLYLVLFCY